MNAEVEKEEKLRESACIGDVEQLRNLVENDKVNIDSKNIINGWYDSKLQDNKSHDIRINKNFGY